MKTNRVAWLACALSIASLGVFAQETTTPETTIPETTTPEAAAAAPAMSPEQQAAMEAWQKAAVPGAPHKQLAEHFVGTWEAKQSFWMDPSAPPMSETGTATSTAELGGRQIRMDFTGQMMGAPFHGINYTGYDNVARHYTSTWIDDMSTGTYMTTGQYDPESRTYTFTGQWPDPLQGGDMLQVRQTVRIVDADHHVMEMYETHEGKEMRTMLIEFSRAK